MAGIYMPVQKKIQVSTVLGCVTLAMITKTSNIARMLQWLNANKLYAAVYKRTQLLFSVPRKALTVIGSPKMAIRLHY